MSDKGVITLRTVALAALVLLLSHAETLFAQELVPRAYWPSPVGTNVLVLGYQYSSGDIVVDQSLPVVGVDSTIDYGQISYQHTTDVLGRTATFSIAQGWADGDTTGFVDGERVERRTVGAMDTVGRFAINLMGAPAMDREAFREMRANPRPIVGASLTVSAPTGAYDKDRVVNLGGNRWAVKPALGAILHLTPSLMLETEAAAWIFQDNDEFVGDTRKQDPVLGLQLHLVKRFRPGLWAAPDANFYTGGRTRVDGVENSDLQRNSRFGATLVYPVAPGHALRVSLSTGTVTENGGDYDLLGLAWIHIF